MLGGIGYTWEHDAHLYLRRAAANYHSSPSPSRWHDLLVDGGGSRGAARAAPGAARRRPRICGAAVRVEVEALAARPKSEWNAALADGGWLCPHWPSPWGRDASALEQLVIDEQLATAGVRRPHLQVAGWVLPTLIAHGTAEQQERFIGASMRGGAHLVPAVQRTRRRVATWRASDPGNTHRRWMAAHRAEGVDDHGRGGATTASAWPGPTPTCPQARRHHAASSWTCPCRGSTSVRCGSSPGSRCSTRSSSTTCSYPMRWWWARSTTAGGVLGPPWRTSGCRWRRGRRSAPGCSSCWTSRCDVTVWVIRGFATNSELCWSSPRRSPLSACARPCVRSRGVPRIRPVPGPEASVRKLIAVEHEQRTQETAHVAAGCRPRWS